MTLRAYVTNLGKYNEGYLVGEWVTFPIDDDEKRDLLNRIGIDGVHYEEIFITDYDIDGISYKDLDLGEFETLDYLNEIAETMDNLDEREQEIVAAMMSEGYEFDDAVNRIDECIVWYDCESMTDVAEQYAEETGLLDSIPENLRTYFDFESFGQDMSFDGQFIFTSSGNCVEVCR